MTFKIRDASDVAAYLMVDMLSLILQGMEAFGVSKIGANVLGREVLFPALPVKKQRKKW